MKIAMRLGSFVAPLFALFLMGSSAQAMTASGGTTSSYLSSVTPNAGLTNLTVSCSANNDISTSQLLSLSLSFTPGAGFSGGISPVAFDTSANVRLTYPGGQTGAVGATPTMYDSLITFPVTHNCNAGDTFTISGVRVKTVGTDKKEGTVKLFARNVANALSSDWFGLDTNPPKLTSGDVTGTADTGIASTMTLHFSEPITYSTSNFGTSQWSVVTNPVANHTNIGDLSFAFNQSVTNQSSLQFALTPHTTAPATMGYWFVKALSGNQVKDSAGNLLSTSEQINVIDAMSPVVKSVSPQPYSQTAPNTPIMISFSEWMNQSTTNVSFSPSVGFTTQWSNDNETLTVTPYNQSYGTTYSVSVQGTALNGGGSLLPISSGVATSAVHIPWTYSTQGTSPVSQNTPTVSLSVNNGATYTSSAIVNVSVNGNGGDQIQFGSNADLSDAGAYEQLTTNRTWTLSPGADTKQVCARVRNNSTGQISPISCDTIILLTRGSDAPTSPSITINNNGASTNYGAVVVSLYANNAWYMALSNYSSFTDAQWEPYNAQKNWYLPSSGTRTIYAIFRGPNGGVSDPVSATITYNGNVSYGQPYGSIMIANGATSVTSIYTTLHFTNTNADQVQLGTSSAMSDAGDYMAIATDRSWALKPRTGTQYVCARFRNSSSGQVSDVQCDGIDLITSGGNAPYSTGLLISQGASSTATQYVTLSVYAANATKMAISNDSSFYSVDWEPFSASRSWTLPGGIGTKTVYAMFASDAGTVSPVIVASIQLTSQGTYVTPNPIVSNKPYHVLPSGLAGGMLIKRSGKPAVYYVGADGYRYVFPSQNVFLSWYSSSDLQGADKGGRVVTVAASTLASLPIGGNVTYRPGVRMVKIDSDPHTYVVDRGGILRWISNADIAVAWYGYGWSSNVDDVSVALFSGYTIGTPIYASSDFNPSSATNNTPTIAVDKGL